MSSDPVVHEGTLLLTRMGSMPFGTPGTLVTPSGNTYATLEPKWVDNKRGESCIPAGNYKLKMRRSPMVERTSRGKYKDGWEVVGVKGRTYIMIHPGNFESDTNGCILVGLTHGCIGSFYGVATSQAAFTKLMSELQSRDEWVIGVRWDTPEN